MTNENQKKLSPWYQTATAIALISAIAACIIVIVLTISYVKTNIIQPEREEQLVRLKQIIMDQPDNQQVLDFLRELDLNFRKQKTSRIEFAKKGNLLLIISLAVFALSFKWICAFKKKLPTPNSKTNDLTEQIINASWSRRAIAAGVILLASIAIYNLIQPDIDFNKASLSAKTETDDEPSAPAFPTFEEFNINWPAFRGPQGNGISKHANIPTGFDTEGGILWKTKVPLPGFNSPVVWDDKVFLSGADENRRQIFCFDANSGKLLWTGDLSNLPGASEPPDVMEDTGFAAPTMTTDGINVYAIFATGHIGAFSFDGKKVWARYLTTPDSAYGYASSLTMYQNLVIVQYDQGAADDGLSKMIAIDGQTGRTTWETKRPVANSWTSPIVAKTDKNFQLITAADPWVISYDPATGKQNWQVDCLGTDAAPSPIYSNGLIFVIKPYSELIAILPNGQGDITKTAIAWTADEGIPDICSPVSNGNEVFILTTQGTLTCFNLTDGKKLWDKELDGEFNASPSLVADNLFLLSIKGDMIVAKASPEFREIRRSKIDDKVYASPAFSDGKIFIRSQENLYCIGAAN
jgi:outer membrane protein assembly factor BamB